MAIGERIHFFRNLRGMTQKYLGMRLGFSERTADVRIAQYESGARVPKEDLIKGMAYGFEVDERALKVPDIDSFLGVMHTLFALEDIYGLKIEKIDEKVCIYTDPNRTADNEDLSMGLSAWEEQAAKYYTGEITKEDYDKWRYNYPKYDTTRYWAHIPDKELSDYLVKQFKKKGFL